MFLTPWNPISGNLTVAISMTSSNVNSKTPVFISRSKDSNSGLLVSAIKEITGLGYTLGTTGFPEVSWKAED